MKPIYLKPDQSLLFVAPKDPKINGWGDKMYIENPPYRPGEFCYVREAWDCAPDDIADQLFFPVRYKAEDCEPFVAWRSPVTMPQWASRRHVRIVSCEPIRVSEVTWHDAIKAGVEAKYCCSGVDCACMGLPIDNPADDFRENWHKKHPGKQWAWRVEVQEVKG